MILSTNEAVKVEQWHAQQMENLGIKQRQAQIAARHGVDWHTVKKLLDKGCPFDLALRIARPL